MGCGGLILLFLFLSLLGLLFGKPFVAGRMSDWGDSLVIGKRFQEAANWYRYAATWGNAHAKAMLARSYGSESQRWEIKTDWESAVKLAGEAAKQNDAEGEFILAEMYYSGAHLPKDLDQAKYWATKAINEGVSGGRQTGNYWDYYIIFGKVEAKKLLARIDEEKGVTSSSSSAPTVRSAPNASAMAVEDLEKAFKNNPKAAEATYTGKTITVSGTAGWVGEGILDKKPALSMSRTNCAFPESARSSVNALRVGQKVTVRGQFDGYLSSFISLKNCELVR